MRESYEVLLAILKKREVSLTRCSVRIKNKKPKLQFSKLDAEAKDDSE